MRVLPVLLLCASFLAVPSFADDRLGGHFGVVFPLITNTDGNTTDITDHVSVGFPTGITVKRSDTFAFDLELVPAIDDSHVSLTVHPGVIWGLHDHWAAGLRAAFDVNQDSYGFTPLINKGFPRGNGSAFFVEGVLPVRFQRNGAGDRVTSIGLGVHFGIGF